MPYPFDLPIPLPSSTPAPFSCPDHPSLPSSLAAHRAILHDILSRHDRVRTHAHLAGLSEIESAVNEYLPLLFTVDASLRDAAGAVAHVSIGPRLDFVWRAPLTVRHRFFSLSSSSKQNNNSSNSIQGRSSASRSKSLTKKKAPALCLHSFNAEIAFTLTTLALTKYLHARSHLQLLHSARDRVDPVRRSGAIAAATKLYLEAYALHDYIATRALTSGPDGLEGHVVHKHKQSRSSGGWYDTAYDQSSSSSAPVRLTAVDIAPSVQRALCEIVVAEATLAVVLKDDPYPSVIADDRDESVTDWMFRAPDIPKVRVTLFGRMCIAAAGHASKAASLLRTVAASASVSSSSSDHTAVGQSNPSRSTTTTTTPTQIPSSLVQYADNLRRVSKAKACRLQGLDAESQGHYGVALGWLRAAVFSLFDVDPGPPSPSSSASLHTPSSHSQLSHSESSATTGLVDRLGASAGFAFLIPVVAVDQQSRHSAAPGGGGSSQSRPFASLAASSRRLVSRIKTRSSGSDPRADEEEKKRRRGDADWGADAGVYEESRIIEMLFYKWSKTNEAFIYPTTPVADLLPSLPSGRDYHTSIPPFRPPTLDHAGLESLRIPAPLDRDRLDEGDLGVDVDVGVDVSSDDFSDEEEGAGGQQRRQQEQERQRQGEARRRGDGDSREGLDRQPGRLPGAFPVV